MQPQGEKGVSPGTFFCSLSETNVDNLIWCMAIDG